MTELQFHRARMERETIRNRFDVLLGIVAVLQIYAGGQLIYHEELFPIVELRAALERWLDLGFLGHEDFEFQSMESDEAGLVWLRHTGDNWRIGSIHQESPALDTLSDAEVAELVRRFNDQVDQWVHDNCQLEVRTLL